MIKTAVENDQDLIVEGCYIPFEWRSDLDSRYLSDIRFICLCMTPDYISSHYEEIVSHASDAERRTDDSDLKMKDLISDNLSFADGFSKAGEELLLISHDWKSSVFEWADSLEQTIDDRSSLKC